MKKIITILAALTTLFMLGCCGQAEQAQPKKQRKVAVQTYSLKKFTLEDSLKKLQPLGLDGIEVYPGQKVWNNKDVKFGPALNAEERATVKKMLADAKLKIVSFGCTGAKDEAGIENLCAFAKDMGICRLVTEAKPELLPLWQKYCQKYGVKMCLHHHTGIWSNPDELSKYSRMYANIKANPDVGHWSRIAQNAVEGLKKVEGVIGSIHFKDQKEFGNKKNQPAPFGEGQLNCKAQLAELDRQGYDGFFVIEYEAEWDNNIPSITKCVKFLREN